MPSFDDFAVWDDVIHPFFLSLAVYLISFGLPLVLIVGAVWYASDSESKIEADKQKIISTIFPDAQNNSNPAGQTQSSNQLSEQLKPDGKPQNGNISTETDIAKSKQNSTNQATELQKLKGKINQIVKARMHLETTEETEPEKGIFNQIGTVLRLSLVFSVPVFLAMLWGIFYFPVACAIAAYTRSFAAILNPRVGFDTIKRLGSDYLKIIVVFLILVASALGLSLFLHTILSPFDLPILGNLPAKALVGFLTFYLSIVFSAALGFALLNKSARLNIRRG